MSTVGVIVVAAGMGTRLGADRPKALVEVAGEPMVVHAVRRARAAADVRQVVVVVPASHRAEFTALVPPEVTLVEGGAERTDSVAAGVAALAPEIDVVLVHDAARAFAPTALFEAVTTAVESGWDAVVPGLSVTDTIKQINASQQVVATPDRATLMAVQTPQGFRRTTLVQAHADGHQATDDAALVERVGGKVGVIPGHLSALKITHPADLEAAERLAAESVRGRVPTLIVLGGLPGVGKTSLARALARRTPFAHLRVDTVETGLRRVGATDVPAAAGYGVLYAIAADQLDLGLSVVADTVNPLAVTREAWSTVAAERGARLLEVELFCSDRALHERRVVERVPDIEGHLDPTWRDVQDREYDAWQPDLRLDSAVATPEELASAVLAELTSQSALRPGPRVR